MSSSEADQRAHAELLERLLQEDDRRTVTQHTHTTITYPGEAHRPSPFAPVLMARQTQVPHSSVYPGQALAASMSPRPEPEPKADHRLLAELLEENDRLRDLVKALSSSSTAAPQQAEAATAAAASTGTAVSTASDQNTARTSSTATSLMIGHKFVDCSSCHQWNRVPLHTERMRCARCSTDVEATDANTHIPVGLAEDRPPCRPWGVCDFLRRACFS